MFVSTNLDSNVFYCYKFATIDPITIDASTATFSSLSLTCKTDYDYSIVLIKNRKISASYSGYGAGEVKSVSIMYG